MYVNWFTAVSLVITAVSLVILGYLIVRQFKETRRPRDGFTKLRKSLVVTPIIAFFCLAPSVPSLATSLQIPPRSNTASFSAMLVRVGVLGFSLSMLYSYTYKEDR